MTACDWGGEGIIVPCHLHCVSFYILMFCNISLIGEFEFLREIRDSSVGEKCICIRKI